MVRTEILVVHKSHERGARLKVALPTWPLLKGLLEILEFNGCKLQFFLLFEL